MAATKTAFNMGCQRESFFLSAPVFIGCEVCLMQNITPNLCYVQNQLWLFPILLVLYNVHANKFPTIELSLYASRVNICKSACNNIVISLAFLTLCQSDWSRKRGGGGGGISLLHSPCTALVIDYLKSHNSITVAIYNREVFFPLLFTPIRSSSIGAVHNI